MKKKNELNEFFVNNIHKNKLASTNYILISYSEKHLNNNIIFDPLIFWDLTQNFIYIH